MTYAPPAAALAGLVTFQQWQDGLEALFAGLLGLEAAACAFLRQPRRQIRGLRLQLDPLTILRTGVEDVRRTVTGALNEEQLVEERIGHRVLVLQVSAWSAEQSLQSAPLFALEQLRTRLRWQSTLDALEALALAFEGAEQPVSVPDRIDGRVQTRATLDIRLAFASVEQDAQNLVDWIGRAIIDGTLRDPAGSIVSTPQIDVDGEIEVTFPTQHFNLGKLAAPSVAAVAGTPDPAAMAEFSQVGIANAQTIAYLHLHGIEDKGSGSMTVEVFRYRASVHTWLASMTLNGGGGHHATAAGVPVGSLIELLPGDYLMAQLTAFTGAGGYDGITCDCHFVAS